MQKLSTEHLLWRGKRTRWRKPNAIPLVFDSVSVHRRDKAEVNKENQFFWIFKISSQLTAAIPVKAPIPLVIPIRVPAKFGERSKALTFIPTKSRKKELISVSTNDIRHFTRIISTHKHHCNCEQWNSNKSIATTIWSQDKEDSRNREWECRVEFSWVGDADELSIHAPIADDAAEHRCYPHGNVWQRRVQSILFNIEL